MRTLEEIQDEVLERLHAGERIDRDALLAQNPEHAEELRRFFSLVEVIESDEQLPPSRLGEFRIVREIGRGGMGIVYEAEQTSLKRKVALKVLPHALARDPRRLARFRREAEAAAGLRHPNIVPVFAVGEAAGTAFFAMELVDGVSLADVLKERRAGNDGGLPRDPVEYRRRILAIAAQIADALSFAHARGIVHRDVKPANVLLDRDGTPRLTDFGLALDLQASALTASGELLGSPQYMSPEQAVRRDAPLDGRTDLYSLSVTICELLTLRLPYEAGTIGEMLDEVAAGRVRSPRALDPKMPKAIERVLLRALQKDPAQRYVDASQFAQDLRAVQRIGGAPARRREAWISAIIIASGASVLLFLFFLVMRVRDPDRNFPFDAPPNAEIAMLADGTSFDGPSRLSRWVKALVKMRSLVARDASMEYWIGLSIPMHAQLLHGIHVEVRWDISIDGAPFNALRDGAVVEDAELGSVAGILSVGSIRADLRQVLGKALDKTAASIRHRATVHVYRVVDDGPNRTRTKGTQCEIETEPKSVLIFDSFPSDYPRVVTDPATDAIMRDAIVPDHLIYKGTEASAGGERYVCFKTERRRNYGHGGMRPALPTALSATCEIYVAGLDQSLGTATVEVSSWSGDLSGAWFEWSMLKFRLPLTPTPDEAAALTKITSGAVRSVRIVMSPSRELALATPELEEYWGGTLDAEVPLVKE